MGCLEGTVKNDPRKNKRYPWFFWILVKLDNENLNPDRNWVIKTMWQSSGGPTDSPLNSQNKITENKVIWVLKWSVLMRKKSVVTVKFIYKINRVLKMYWWTSKVTLHYLIKKKVLLTKLFSRNISSRTFFWRKMLYDGCYGKF